MNADLYFDRIDFYKYLPKKDCGECGFNCKEFAEKLKKGDRAEKCPYLKEIEVKFLNLAVDAKNFLKIPIYSTTIKTKTGLIFSNKRAVTLVTANYPYTQAAVSEVMVRAGIDFNLLIIDTEGYSIDMAVYLGLFRAEKIAEKIEELEKVDRKKIVIPGLAEKFRDEIEEVLGHVILGPVCCAELPIFLLKNGLLVNFKS
ncbi:MAG: (Fe-S)-binding protein [Archaeoglobaceae archaeon]